jgi:molybdopterin-biosynthesis enzyme MoeA-like protein
MSQTSTPIGFGLIIVGSEILDGRIQDRHFENTKKLLSERNHPLRYSMVLADDPDLILDKLKWAMSRPEPVFCCGGIGSTPDDYTRQCAAESVGVPLEVHEEGVKILKKRFGKKSTTARLKMVEFPKGATLIPNPVNQIPGFSIGDAHFLPGFPSMAEPMTAWVLRTYYGMGEVKVTRALRLPGAREADLVPMMEAFTETHPSIDFFSLPKFVDGGTEVLVGLSGAKHPVDKGIDDLQEKLEAMGQKWEEKS